MGGWMSYQRARNRNGGVLRETDGNRFYPSPAQCEGKPAHWYQLTGDFNRMEAGYLDPEWVVSWWPTLSLEHSPLYETAEATGVDVETVRRVLQFVLREQR